MNNIKKQIKSMQQSKNRLALILGASSVAVVAVIFLAVHFSGEKTETSHLSSSPRIESLPGVGKSSDKYVSDQKDQNAKNAQKAAANASSAVPTITRPSFVGNPADFANMPEDNSALAPAKQENGCPLKKMVVMYKPNPASCTIENLKLARKTGVTAEELLCQGCSCPSLKLAGYTVGDLKDIGLSAKDLKKCGFTLKQLMLAGFSANDLKEAGFSAKDLADAGFSAGQLANAGFSADDLKKAGFSDKDIANAGVDMKELCDPAALKKAKADGTTAAELKERGCGVAALKAAGYTAKDLKDAGFSAADLHQAGFSNDDLKNAGFTPDEIAAAATMDKDCSPEALKKKRAEGVSATALKQQGCGLAALKAAGYTAKELKDAGFSAADLKKAGYSAEDLKNAGFSAADLKDAGFSAADLKKAGFSAADLKDAGFSAGALKAAGFDAGALSAAGFSAEELHNAGFSAAQLKAAGFTADELKDAGYTSGDLLRSGFSPEESGYAAQADTTSQPQTKQSTDNNQPTTADSSNSVKIPSIDGSDNDDAVAKRLRDLAERQQQQMNAQQRAQALAQTQANMTMQSQQLISAWGQHQAQAMTAAPVEQDTNNAAAGNGSSDAVDGKIYKAGTVMYAVLDTSVNSDESTPIMASIVSGPLKGSKLLGSFQRYDKKLMISFNVLNNPNLSKTIAINAVAIDPDTARTALSGEVDNHYLLRYGSLFAASFLQGMGQSYQSFQSNSGTIYIGDSYNEDAPNATQVALQGLGQVGQSAGTEMKPIFNKAPTIKIGSGTGMGLLLTKDLTVPYGDNLDQPSLADAASGSSKDAKSSDKK